MILKQFFHDCSIGLFDILEKSMIFKQVFPCHTVLFRFEYVSDIMDYRYTSPFENNYPLNHAQCLRIMVYIFQDYLPPMAPVMLDTIVLGAPLPTDLLEKHLVS